MDIVIPTDMTVSDIIDGTRQGCQVFASHILRNKVRATITPQSQRRTPMVSAPVYGDIKPQDDYTHPLGTEPNFNDSMYFNFFDNAKNFGGFMRIGNRANEKYAEVTLVVYQPDGSVL